MANYIYAKSGMPAGFQDGNLIFDLHCRPVGRLRGSQVYCMAGHYAGELKDDVILKNKRSHAIPAARAARSTTPRRSGTRQLARKSAHR